MDFTPLPEFTPVIEFTFVLELQSILKLAFTLVLTSESMLTSVRYICKMYRLYICTVCRAHVFYCYYFHNIIRNHTAACGEVGYMLLIYGASILWMFSLRLALLMNSLHSDALVGLFHFQPQSMKLSLLDTSLIAISNFRADNTLTVKSEY